CHRVPAPSLSRPDRAWEAREHLSFEAQQAGTSMRALLAVGAIGLEVLVQAPVVPALRRALLAGDERGVRISELYRSRPVCGRLYWSRLLCQGYQSPEPGLLP